MENTINKTIKFLQFIQELDSKKQNDFYQFIQGVEYGMQLTKKKEEEKYKEVM